MSLKNLYYEQYDCEVNLKLSFFLRYDVIRFNERYTKKNTLILLYAFGDENLFLSWSIAYSAINDSCSFAFRSVTHQN